MNKIYHYFNKNSAKVEIIGKEKKEYLIQFFYFTNLIYETKINNNSWSSTTHKANCIKVYNENKLIFEKVSENQQPHFLHNLGVKHGTDKSNLSHSYNGVSYLDIYEQHLNKIRYEATKIVEIGVLDGKSLLMWQEYFPNATIYGIDINPDCKKYETDRIKIFIGDQNNEKFLTNIKKEIGEYDMLIDDGSHITNHQLLGHLLP